MTRNRRYPIHVAVMRPSLDNRGHSVQAFSIYPIAPRVPDEASPLGTLGSGSGPIAYVEVACESTPGFHPDSVLVFGVQHAISPRELLLMAIEGTPGFTLHHPSIIRDQGAGPCPSNS
jgi:hypothetical protein